MIFLISLDFYQAPLRHHTIVEDYFRIEASLLKNPALSANFILFIEEEDYDETIFNDDSLYEMWQLLLTIKQNKEIINNLFNCIFFDIFKKNNLGVEVSTVTKSIETSLSLLTKGDNLRGLAYFTAVWVFIGFCDSPLHHEKTFLEKNFMYFSRYYLMGHLSKMFNKLILMLNELNFLKNPPFSRGFLKKTCLIIYHTLAAQKILLRKTVFNRTLGKNMDFGDTDKGSLNVVGVGFFNMPSVENSLKSEVFFALKNPAWCNLSIWNLQLYLHPPVLTKINTQYYFISRHYSNCDALIRKNFLSHKNSFMGDVSFINKRASLKLFIKWDLFDFIKEKAFKYYGLSPEDYEGYNCKLGVLKKKIWQQACQKQFSEVYPLIFFILVGELKYFLKNGFYFRYYFDFRGRLYADSPISYTNNIWFRYLFFYGFYTDNEILNFKKKIKTTDLADFYIIYNNSILTKEFKSIDYNDVFIQYYINIIFIEIGKLFKKKKIDELGGRITRGEFIALGVENFQPNQWEKLDLNKQIELWSLYFILKNLEEKKFKKIPLFKDATASGIQILSLILGVARTEYFSWLNLTTPGVWHDTYYFIIKLFKEKHPILKDKDDLEKYFTRENLKKTIMTYNYNATYLRCWKNFKQESGLGWDSPIVLINNAENYFKSFYKFLNWLFLQNNFYQTSPKHITLYFSEEFIKNDLTHYRIQDDFFVALKYYLLDKGARFDRIIGGERVSMVFHELTETYDAAKTRRALQANITHAFDAYVLRHIVLKMSLPLITIHDSIGVDILNIKNFEEVVCQSYSHLYSLNLFNLSCREPDTTFIQGDFIFL